MKKYNEKDFLIIFSYILDNNYDEFKNKYSELSKHYTSLKMIIDIFMNEIKAKETCQDTSIFIEEVVYLSYVIDALEYINKPLTNDDKDTIRLLLNLANLKRDSLLSFHRFKNLLMLTYGYEKISIDNDISELNEAVGCFLENYDKIKIKRLNVKEIIRKLYDASFIVDKRVKKNVYFRGALINLLIIYGVVNNNFDYFYNYVNNLTYYEDHIFFNGYISHKLEEDIKKHSLVYNNIEKIFKAPNCIIR